MIPPTAEWPRLATGRPRFRCRAGGPIASAGASFRGSNEGVVRLSPRRRWKCTAARSTTTAVSYCRECVFQGRRSINPVPRGVGPLHEFGRRGRRLFAREQAILVLIRGPEDRLDQRRDPAAARPVDSVSLAEAARRLSMLTEIARGEGHGDKVCHDHDTRSLASGSHATLRRARKSRPANASDKPSAINDRSDQLVR